MTEKEEPAASKRRLFGGRYSNVEHFAESYARSFWQIVVFLFGVGLALSLLALVWSFTPTGTRHVVKQSYPDPVEVALADLRLEDFVPQGQAASQTPPPSPPSVQTDPAVQAPSRDRGPTPEDLRRRSPEYSRALDSLKALFTTVEWNRIIARALTVRFTIVNIESPYDRLLIYDGPSTSSSLLISITGSDIPGPITATNPAGALTFRFISDGSYAYQGWEAVVGMEGATGSRPLSMTAATQTVSDVLFMDPGGSSEYRNNMDVTHTLMPVADTSGLAEPRVLADLYSDFGISDPIQAAKLVRAFRISLTGVSELNRVDHLFAFRALCRVDLPSSLAVLSAAGEIAARMEDANTLGYVASWGDSEQGRALLTKLANHSVGYPDVDLSGLVRFVAGAVGSSVGTEEMAVILTEYEGLFTGIAKDLRLRGLDRFVNAYLRKNQQRFGAMALVDAEYAAAVEQAELDRLGREELKRENRLRSAGASMSFVFLLGIISLVLLHVSMHRMVRSIESSVGRIEPRG